VLNKVLISLGSVLVLGMMAAGVAYAVTGTGDQGRTGEGGSRGWQGSETGAVNGRAEGQGESRRPKSGAGGAGGRWSPEGTQAGDALAASGDQVSARGIVQSVEASLMVLETEDGKLVEASLGQSGYWEAQGISLAAGDGVVVNGYYEQDGKLAASSVTVLATGQTIALRDGSGRPMWAGGRRSGSAGDAPVL
jgi:hypothetical protein